MSVLFLDLSHLKGLEDFFLNCLGPRGCVKAFVSPVQHLSLTSTSERLLYNLQQFLCDKSAGWQAFMVASKAFLDSVGDGGLRHAALTASIVLLLAPLDPFTSNSYVEELGIIVNQVIEENQIRVNFSSTNHLQALVKSKLSSKHWMGNSQMVRFYCKKLPE